MDGGSSGTTVQSPSTYSESSKTGSTKSGEAGREEDFTKDNTASPIDLECHIQSERITKLLGEAIYKTKLSLCLPRLVREFNFLSSILKRQDLDDLVFIYEQYDNPLFTASLDNFGALEDIKAGDVSLKNRLNPELGHLIYILNGYPELRAPVEEIINEIRSKRLPSEPLNRGLEYLSLLEQFRDLMLRQMTFTAAEVLAEKIQTRMMEHSNATLIEKIEECGVTIKEEQEQFIKTMELKSDIIAKLEEEVAVSTAETRIRLKKKILDSDRQMVLATRSHHVKYEMLKEEVVETTEGYATVLRGHILEEKNQRARRSKVQTQLMSWLQKYDYEMADKQVELDDFIQKYEGEIHKVEDLEEKLAEQDKEFVPLMEERENEYHQEMAEKMEMFLVQHAARVIQVAWRDVLANRAEKKRLKKLQKKMIAEAEAAEKAAAAQAKAAAAAARAAAKAAKAAAKAAND